MRKPPLPPRRSLRSPELREERLVCFKILEKSALHSKKTFSARALARALSLCYFLDEKSELELFRCALSLKLKSKKKMHVRERIFKKNFHSKAEKLKKISENADLTAPSWLFIF